MSTTVPRNRAWISKPEIAVLTQEPVLVEDVEAGAEPGRRPKLPSRTHNQQRPTRELHERRSE
jgi:hypothetical protein